MVNYDKKSNWNLEDGYSADAGTETYPERVLGAGARAGLFVLVKGMESDYDHICRGPVQGFKVINGQKLFCYRNSLLFNGIQIECGTPSSGLLPAEYA